VTGPRYHRRGGDDELSPRELEVLALAAEGLTASQTARAMHRSVWTAKQHRRNIMAKLGARNMTHAAVLAVRKGLL